MTNHTITATARTALHDATRHHALITVPLDGDPDEGGMIDERALGAILRQRGIISADIRDVYLDHVEGWHYAVMDVDTESTIAGLEVHAGAGA